MFGKKYLPGMDRLKLAECGVILTGAFNEYFLNLFPVDAIDNKDRGRVMAEAMRREDNRVIGAEMDYFNLTHKAGLLYDEVNPILIGGNC